MNTTTSQRVRIVLIVFLLGFCLSPIYAQVGIGTTSPNSNALLDIDATTNTGGLLLPRLALTATNNFTPLTAHVQGMLVYNTATAGDVTPGQYYNDGSKWIRMEGADPIESVTLTSDTSITSAFPTYQNITGISDLTFTARKSSVFVMLTASGYGVTGSMALVALRVRNITSGSTVGGTVNKIQNYDNVTGTITTWSASFSKLLTGLTIGNTYTLRVQGAVSGISGFRTAFIEPASTPDAEHLTLTVMQ